MNKKSVFSLVIVWFLAFSASAENTNAAPRLRLVSSQWGATEYHERAAAGVVENLTTGDLDCRVIVRFYDEAGNLIQTKPAFIRGLAGGEKWAFAVAAPSGARSFKVDQPMAKIQK